MNQTKKESRHLGTTLRAMLTPPWQRITSVWSWKTAAISAVLRAFLFFFANRSAGGHHAVRAMLVEAGFAIFASGALGAATQLVRNAKPVWATALLVWLGMPAVMLVAQAAVHHAFGTKHLRAGLIGSFVFASVASGFTWYAMQRGTLLAGAAETSVGNDAKQMPRIVLDFVLAVPRWLMGKTASRKKQEVGNRKWETGNRKYRASR